MPIKNRPVVGAGIGAAAVMAVSAAMASPGSSAGALLGGAPVTLDGGGDTLAAIAYVGSSWYTADPANPARLSAPPQPGSLLAEYTAKTLGKPQATYCQTGGAYALLLFEGYPSLNAESACGRFAQAPAGFSAARPAPDFIAADLPMSQSDYGLFLAFAQSAHTEPVQVPAIAAAVAIVYRDAGVDSLALSDAQICGIFSGRIVNWSQLGLPAKPLKLVYRSDASGATFALSNHLAAVCPALGVDGLSASASFSGAPSPVVNSAPPPGAIAVSGNQAMTAAVAATDGALGYAEAAAARLLQPQLGMAAVNGFDPLRGFSAPALATLADQVLAGDDAGGRPKTAAVSAPGPAGCVIMADPAAYANPAGSYPIVGISYLLAYGSGNGSRATALRSLLDAPGNGSIARATTTVGADSGFAFANIKNIGITMDKCIKH